MVLPFDQLILYVSVFICLCYEFFGQQVLTFPILLDDQSLAAEFQTFIEAIDHSHELKLDGNQQYSVQLHCEPLSYFL